MTDATRAQVRACACVYCNTLKASCPVLCAGSPAGNHRRYGTKRESQHYQQIQTPPGSAVGVFDVTQVLRTPVHAADMQQPASLCGRHPRLQARHTCTPVRRRGNSWGVALAELYTMAQRQGHTTLSTDSLCRCRSRRWMCEAGGQHHSCIGSLVVGVWHSAPTTCKGGVKPGSRGAGSPDQHAHAAPNRGPGAMVKTPRGSCMIQSWPEPGFRLQQTQAQVPVC